MSDNEDLLADDLGEHSLADYNIDNEEEEQLLADDYERGESQNVPTALTGGYSGVDATQRDYTHDVEYPTQLPPPVQQYASSEPECVVPNITVEVPNIPSTPVIREPLPTYAPYPDEHAIHPPILAAPVESPQIVPSDATPFPNGEARQRFISERPVGAQRLPQVRDIPDTLDQVVVPRGTGGPVRGRNSWRNPALRPRHHPYTHYNARGHYNSRPSFPPPRPQMRPEIRPDPPQLGPDPDRPQTEFRPPQTDFRPPEERFRPPQEFRPPDFRPQMEGPFHHQNFQRFPNQFRPRIDGSFRPRMEEPRPNFRPNFERPFFRPFGPHIREVIPGHVPQVTIRQQPNLIVSAQNAIRQQPNVIVSAQTAIRQQPNVIVSAQTGRDQEVRMLPVQLPPNLPPGGLQGKKVLINPHFKGNFQPPDGLPLIPTYIPTRIQKSPPRPLSPTLESKFGPIKDIDDAAERFIAEQRDALARAAGRQQRRSPQRYIENTTIEIENDLARPPPKDDDDLLRRQEEFINANRAGLRRRMRSPAGAARRRARTRSPPPDAHDEDSEYRRRLREQETLRERVLRAKEVRRRKNAVALITREREQQEKDKEKERDRLKSPPPPDKTEEKRPLLEKPKSPELVKPDTTRKSPERETKREEPKEGKTERERSPVKRESEVNSTCDSLTPPRPESAALTPPLPAPASDDELELILDDIEGILSDDDDTPRPEPKPAKPKVTQIDLRAKLPPKSTSNESKKERQKIVFTDDRGRKREKSPAKAKSPPRRTVVTSTKASDKAEKTEKSKHKSESSVATTKSRQRIIFEANKETEKSKREDAKPKFSNRRVILQRKTTQPKDKASLRADKTDPTQPNPGIFSRAVRTAIGTDNRIVIKKPDEPQIEFEDESDEEDRLLNEIDSGLVANVANLPHGMTDTRLKTLAGSDVQNLTLDKEERNAKITFKTSTAADAFRRKFNNKMVAASRLTVTLK